MFGQGAYMGEQRAVYHLHLSGAFRLSAPDGVRIDVPSKRGQALLAMLATATNGERTRAWLQDRLWGMRAPEQAQASLRRELSNLRKRLHSPQNAPWLCADFQRVWIDLDAVEVDVRSVAPPHAPLLEGLDIAGEEGFEDWLRAERMALDARAAPPSNQSETAQMDAAVPESAPLGQAPAPSEFAKRPAIAVLPFGVTGGGERAAMMAQGLSEDVLDRLSRLRWLPVIAHASASGVEPGAAGKLLGARYLVTGQLRPAAEQGLWTLSASLTDSESGQLLWSARLDLTDTGAATQEMLTSIAAILGLKIDQYEQARAVERAHHSHAYADLIWRGRWHLARLSRTDAAAAKACFDEALAIAPQSAEALIQSAWVRLYDLWVTRGSQADIRDVRQMAQRAIIADYDDARGHMLAGIAEIWLRQPLRAEALLRRAIALNPSLVMAHSQLGTALNLQGRHGDALDNLSLAHRLSPNDPELFFTLGEMAGAHLMMGDHQSALDFAERSLARRAAYWFAHVVKINALVGMADNPAAARAYADLMTAKPDFAASHIDWLPYLDPMKHDFLKAGLNRATA